MSKQFHIFLALILLWLVPTTQRAQTIENGVLSNCMSLSGKYEVPNTVTYIAPYAFWGSGVTEVVIANTVDSIGDAAFQNALQLTKISFAANSRCTRIGDDAFSDCIALSDITLPNSLTHLGKRAFWLNEKLSNITLSSNLEHIQPYTFQGCVSLHDLALPSGLKILGENALAGCNQLLSVEMPSCDSIATKAFFGCKLLGSIELPSNLTIIADSAFMRCERLARLTLPRSVEKVGAKLFRGCPKMNYIGVETESENFVSQDGVLYSKDLSVLYEVPALYQAEMFELPQETKTIYHMAFFECFQVEGINIHSNVERIGIGSLSNNGFTAINLANSARYFMEDQGLYYISTLEDGSQHLVLMARATRNPNDSCIVKYGTSLVAPYAAMGCASIIGIRLPSTLLSVEDNAFAGCTGLTHISCYAETPPELKETSFSEVDGRSVLVHVYPQALSKYMTNPYWALFNYGEDLSGEEPLNNQQIFANQPNLQVSTSGDGFYRVQAAGQAEIFRIEAYDLQGQRLCALSTSSASVLTYSLGASQPHLLRIYTSQGVYSHKVL